ncbi:HNH endonuclease [Sulfitobacter sp. PS-8MA]|uniref:HNH endonuclease n=1 Tax=Sulfitobacter sp. PS-8MA TaxID=3237707 RepID=UPI0034C5E898
MAKKPLPCPTVLRQLLRYEPETGKLFWKERPSWMFKLGGVKGQSGSAATWNARYAGKEAFTALSHGYPYSSINDRSVLAHRVIWTIVTGTWPGSEVDHIDGDRANNSWQNLRLVTSSQNKMNRGVQRNSTSGHKGVGFHKASGRWRAYIKVLGKQRHLGHFDTMEGACEAYRAAAAKYHGEFARFEW